MEGWHGATRDRRSCGIERRRLPSLHSKFPANDPPLWRQLEQLVPRRRLRLHRTADGLAAPGDDEGDPRPGKGMGRVARRSHGLLQARPRSTLLRWRAGACARLPSRRLPARFGSHREPLRQAVLPRKHRANRDLRRHDGFRLTARNEGLRRGARRCDHALGAAFLFGVRRGLQRTLPMAVSADDRRVRDSAGRCRQRRVDHPDPREGLVGARPEVL